MAALTLAIAAAIIIIAVYMLAGKCASGRLRRLAANVRALAIPRVTGTVGHRHMLERLLRLLPRDISRVDEFEYRGQSYRNVTAAIGNGTRRVVFVAHTDSACTAGDAATDAAAACAVLLELARTLTLRPPANVRVEFAFVDGEEARENAADVDNTPLLAGSRRYMDTAQLTVHDLVIVCDLIGAGGALMYAPGSDMITWERLHMLAPAVFSDRAAETTVDDHTPFVEAGIPCVLLSAWPFPPRWHTTLPAPSTTDSWKKSPMLSRSSYAIWIYSGHSA